MPKYAIDQLEKVLGNLSDLTLLILGVSYRSNVKETAFSGVFDLVKEIEKRGARAVVSDPLYSGAEIESLGLSLYLGNSSNVDAIILHTNHSIFSKINFSVFTKCQVLYDGRNFFVSQEIFGDCKFIALGNHLNGVK
jgi:UDP-N-acetyl-D-mannosaminuronate dehydrogenase